MYKLKKVAVVIPAHNEEKLIQRTVSTIPQFVDKIIVIDDCSSDKTSVILKEMGAVEVSELDATDQESRIILIRHTKNQGVGGAISTGYKWCRDNGIDLAAVMAGDAQMDPSDLPRLIEPVASGQADYCKGNRLFTGEAWKKIPKTRYIGNSVLSFLTKIASGYWHIADSQSGYTVINARMLRLIDWDYTRKGYGCPNDYLVRLNLYNARVCDVPVKPVYGIGETSGIRLHTEIPRLSWLIVRLFWWRMFHKYVIRDFHPLILFYLASIILTVPGFLFGADLLRYRIFHGPVAATSVLFAVFLMTMGVQFGLFAMWFDMESNKHLNHFMENNHHPSVSEKTGL